MKGATALENTSARLLNLFDEESLCAMGITVIPDLIYKEADSRPDLKLSEIATKGKYYRHPDSAFISYPLVVQKPLGTINKSLNIAIIGGGAAGVAALYELSNLKDSETNISVTLYESDPDHFLNAPPTMQVSIAGLKAGRVSAAISSDEPAPKNLDHAVYEIGAMRFPEIAGLMWHYANVVYDPDLMVSPFPNPGTVPTEILHGDRVDRYAGKTWLNDSSPTKQIIDIVRKSIVGQTDGANISNFPIGNQDPAKVGIKLGLPNTTEEELKTINEDWKKFVKDNDKYTLRSAVRMVIEKHQEELPDVAGLKDIAEKTSYYVELFGTVAFGTGGFKSVYNMSIVEMMRLLLWNYDNEYVLPVKANVEFIRDLYLNAVKKNKKVTVKSARVCDVCHLDINTKVETMVVYYDVVNGTEVNEPKKEVYDYVILATTPRQTSSITGKIGFNNASARRPTLGEHERQLTPDQYEGSVRPALVLSKLYDIPNSKLFTAVSNVHMVCCSKIFATVKKADFDTYAPEFLDKGKIKAIVADCGLGSTYVVPATIVNEKLKNYANDYYSFLISYAWEDDSKGMQHNFGKYPLNIADTKKMVSSIIGRATRYVYDPVKKTYGPWWFGEALSKSTLEDPLSYDWTTFHTAGAYKLNYAGDNQNSDLLFRYHTHALKPALKNKFFLANCSYSNLGGWIEGAFMSAVNAVCGLIVAANDGDINSLNSEAQKVVGSLDNVVENDE
ncbi:Phenylalanine 2-monooxygenase precursor [Pseudolycoriella hygida]|uniref:Phenylalanine 2-monooxygenase n=1 Tax=Pseudolycoriella hygida TaxID=35572 RepID=A0A9Q0S3U9_9DIPT|nr:Phenylalanine 2-monooxygenase precursor [Pseudolycoriella hygida]